jgi:hypothetical protein
VKTSDKFEGIRSKLPANFILGKILKDDIYQIFISKRIFILKLAKMK